LIDASVSTLRSLYPQGHQDLASTLLSQGQSRLRLGDAAGAVASTGEALAMARQHVGESHRLFPPFLLARGDALRQAGDAAAAEPLLREAVERLTNLSTDPNDLVLANARAKYGDVLSIAGRYDDAERQLKQSFDAISSTRTVSDRRVQGIVRLLMMHYERAGRPLDAARFRAMLAAPLG
jgi:tetratricopeptide (TPR) repeat protein